MTEEAMYKVALESAVEKIKEENAKITMIQLPDGLKPQAKDIKNELEEKTNTKVLIWAGSCYGSCDTPVGIEKFNVDLLIHFGHTAWKYN